MSWAVTRSCGFLSDSIGYLKSFSPVTKVQNVFQGIAKRIYREVIELSPDNFRWAECLLVLSINNRYVTLAWTLLHTIYGGQKFINQIEGEEVLKTALKIALFTYATRQASASLLEVPGDSMPCVGGVNEAIRPSLDCLIAGKKVAECAALVDESYNSSIFVVTQQNGKVLLVTTNPSSTSACFFAWLNTTMHVVRVCLDDVNKIQSNITAIDPMMLGNIYDQLADGRSIVHVKMMPIWPWDVPCEFVHDRPADLDLGNDMSCVLLDFRPQIVQTFCFNPKNPSAVSFKKMVSNMLAQVPRGKPMVYVFKPREVKILLNDKATIKEEEDHKIC